MRIELLEAHGVSREPQRSSTVPRHLDLKAKTQKPVQADENDFEGHQDMGGKQGGQVGFPKPTKRPHSSARDEDVVPKRGRRDR